MEKKIKNLKNPKKLRKQNSLMKINNRSNKKTKLKNLKKKIKPRFLNKQIKKSNKILILINNKIKFQVCKNRKNRKTNKRFRNKNWIIIKNLKKME
jgi:hypothetical protein